MLENRRIVRSTLARRRPDFRPVEPQEMAAP
jgi:hypothetical protein